MLAPVAVLLLPPHAVSAKAAIMLPAASNACRVMPVIAPASSRIEGVTQFDMASPR
jgi:hypothetical protein